MINVLALMNVYVAYISLVLKLNAQTNVCPNLSFDKNAGIHSPHMVSYPFLSLFPPLKTQFL